MQMSNINSIYVKEEVYEIFKKLFLGIQIQSS